MNPFSGQSSYLEINIFGSINLEVPFQVKSSYLEIHISGSINLEVPFQTKSSYLEIHISGSIKEQLAQQFYRERKSQSKTKERFENKVQKFTVGSIIEGDIWGQIKNEEIRQKKNRIVSMVREEDNGGYGARIGNRRNTQKMIQSNP